jgi:tRNA dimethylallyltransferase
LAAVRLPVIAGTTAAGKSSLAMALAGELPLTIISADSRQLYRGFDIGTAKPTAFERARVPHELIDVCHAAERFTAARWAAAAESAIDAALAAGRIPVIVGGTGLYMRALFEPLFHEPPLDADARRALAEDLGARTTEDLRRQVAVLDPPRAHLGRTQLLRAIEVAMLTGTPISAWYARAPRPARHVPSWLVLDRGAALHACLEARLDAMLAGGWLDEVRHLDAVCDEASPAWNATGYTVVRGVVRGTTAPAAARHQILVDTRQYAKRQRTWFRHQLPEHDVMRLDAGAGDTFQRALAWLRGWERP